MHTNRIAVFAALSVALIGGALVACTDARTSVTPVSPAAVADRADVVTLRTADARANEDPATFRRVPAQFRWVGEEHNRLLDHARGQLAAVRKNDSAAYFRMTRDCAWVYAALGNDIDASAERGGFASHRADALRAGRAGIERLPRCQQTMLPSLSLFAAPAESLTPAPAPGSDDEISDATIAVLDALIADLNAANSPGDVDAAIARASNAAAYLPMGQSDAVYAAASLTAGSAGYWGVVYSGPNAMALFARETSNWERFKGAVMADAIGCAGFLSTIGKMPFPWQVKIAGCLITGAAASVMYAF